MSRLRMAPFFVAIEILIRWLPAVCLDYPARMVFFLFGTLFPLLCSIWMGYKKKMAEGEGA
jgi:hypothetical protein